jgi:hypothetical protein
MGGYATTGGYFPNRRTEEYNGASWSDGGDLGSPRDFLSGAGTLSAGVCMGGIDSSSNQASNVTEEYDGTSWSSGGNLVNARFEMGGAGTQSAGLSMGGYDSNYSYSNVTEEYHPGPGSYDELFTATMV